MGKQMAETQEQGVTATAVSQVQRYFCEECGAVIELDMLGASEARCGECGSILRPFVEERAFCRICGRSGRPGYGFCSSQTCGGRMISRARFEQESREWRAWDLVGTVNLSQEAFRIWALTHLPEGGIEVLRKIRTRLLAEDAAAAQAGS